MWATSPPPTGTNSNSADLTTTSSRTISTSNGLLPLSSRYKVRVTVVPFGPRISSIARSSDQPSVFSSKSRDASLTRKIKSPAWTPALAAGESGSGVIAAKIPSLYPNSIPTPLKVPAKSSPERSFSSGERYIV